MDLDPCRTTAVVPLSGDDLVIVAAEFQAGVGPGVEVVLDGNWTKGKREKPGQRTIGQIITKGERGKCLLTGASDSLLLANGPELVERGLLGY